jgi:AcrR family transcriptional regulator
MNQEATEPTLRERKKRRQREEIIANAITLFRESSFESTRVRQIAERCEISEATFFNYFPSKDAVLGEWARAAVDLAFLHAAERSPDGSLRRAVRDVVRELAGQVVSEPALQRAAWMCARAAPAAPTARGRPSIGTGTQGLVERARERGEVRGDVEVEQLAELLTSTVCSTIAHWVARDVDGEAEDLEPRLQRAVDLLLDAFRKRNERVAGPTPGPSA